MTRRVAWVGSSGGGAATLGHTDPNALCLALRRQLSAIGVGACLVAAQVVVCEAPLDMAGAEDRAALWAIGEEGGAAGGELVCVLRSSLSEVNARAAKLDLSLSEKVPSLDGLISISADAKSDGVNARSLAAAGRAGLPVAGTGGSSLSAAAAEWGVRLVGNAGGSVATTPTSKAIGIAAALASAWGIRRLTGACLSSSLTLAQWRCSIALPLWRPRPLAASSDLSPRC
ncbi:hypothetical protein T492DRAFT_511398 [Pavlovales sp. CCMP2436]|nr:hypothetical protein T492DRAFT_511398 [Pavlovales sp. CCMP2436]